MTPLSFGGGIRDTQVLTKIHKLPIERILLNSAYIEKNKNLMDEAINLLGKQALVAVLPFRFQSDKFEYFNSSLNEFQDCDINFVDKYSNEVMFINTDLDGQHYSARAQFYPFPIPNSKVILSGGINRTIVKQLRNSDYAAVCFDNASLHHEFNFSQL